MVFGTFKEGCWNKKLLKLHSKMKYESIPAIHKRSGVFLRDCCEVTPIVFNDKLLIINFLRKNVGGPGIQVIDYFSGNILRYHPWEYGLGCAFVENGIIHIYGTSDWSTQNGIYKTCLVDNFDIGETEKVWDASDNQVIFNTSVCSDGKNYYMAYETREPNVKNFSIRFLISKDLIHWEMIGKLYRPDVYAACPTLRNSKGWFYIFYLRDDSAYVEFISRTRNFDDYEEFTGNEKYGANIQVLSPKSHLDECVNNSDIDFVEYHGYVYFVYTDGDQRTWNHVRTAVYFGSLESFFAEFFPPE